MSGASLSDVSSPDDFQHLDRQLCFRLYAASRLVTRLYSQFLDEIGITYPQYVVLLILWESSPCSVSSIGARAMLNTNTLTPLLKRLELLGYVRRQRCVEDERVVEVSLTEEGLDLKSRCQCIPVELMNRTGFPPDKIEALCSLLDDLLQTLRACDFG